MSPAVRVRPPSVAGAFYPGDAADLGRTVDALVVGDAPAPAPKALVLPHAGYVYSGPIAGHGYATVLPAVARIERVLLLGPAHFVPVAGLATTDADAWATPLGAVEIDDEASEVALRQPGVSVAEPAHAPEHSLEVHLPFLQRLLPSFRVLPLVVGRADADTVAGLLDALWGGLETLIVVSTDLSHYHPYDVATALDRRTADRIVGGDADGVRAEDACGAAPLRGLLVAARRHGLRTELVDLRNSGDTAGPRDRVVGYGAFALRAPA